MTAGPAAREADSESSVRAEREREREGEARGAAEGAGQERERETRGVESMRGYLGRREIPLFSFCFSD